jgi:ActR/RegA family two-component response regulator
MKRSKRRRQEIALALACLAATTAVDAKLDIVIDRHITRVMKATDHNISLAAEVLGMHRRSLQRYLRRKRKSRRRA